MLFGLWTFSLRTGAIQDCGSGGANSWRDKSDRCHQQTQSVSYSLARITDCSHASTVHGIVRPGCPRCRKPFYTVSQFIDLSEGVLPPLLDRLSSKEHGSQAREAAERTTQTQVGIRRS